MLTLALVLLSAPQFAGPAAAPQRREELRRQTSPLGTASLELTPTDGDLHRLTFDLEIREGDDDPIAIPAVTGNGFYLTERESIIVLDACESHRVPTSLRVIDYTGHVLHERGVRGLTMPRLSPSGEHFAYRTPKAIHVLDLETFALTRHRLRSAFALTDGGDIVDQLPLTTSRIAPGAPPLGGGSRNATPAPGLPWPLGSGEQRAVGNTYAEYQNYGGSAYMHPGVDVMGADLEPVYAVKSGYVKAVLTTSAQYHWRVAIADSNDTGTTAGYLYAHLDLPTIAVSVGDYVRRGQFLGNLVPWPVASFTHCHFARIEDQGAVWNGSWLCTRNPHTRFRGMTETSAPVFENAIGTDLFAFCYDETSIYLDPSSLNGQVDIIVRVGDDIATSWKCSVQEIRYTIYAAVSGNVWVDDKLAVRFDMPLDTYQGGPLDPFLVDLLYKEDATCDTDGDYGSREFYHIITNSNGDDVFDLEDLNLAWDTEQVPDGDYVIEVTAWDAAGNSATASMDVAVEN